jgi:hypothetical protein
MVCVKHPFRTNHTRFAYALFLIPSDFVVGGKPV